MWALKKVGIRLYQYAFYAAAYALPWHRPELIEGDGCVTKLPAAIKARGFKKVLIVTDPGLMKVNLLDGLFEAMKKEGVDYALFDTVEPNPKIDNIEQAREMYISEKCDALVAFGGGSSIDTAKAVGARIARPKKSIEQLGGTLKVLKKIPFLFAIPTTAGTGSEGTIASVVTNRETHHKYSINDLVLTPKVAVMDPLLTVGLPPRITAPTGMDALTHAVEAYLTQNVPKWCKRDCKEAVKLIFANLETAYKDGKNIEARRNMLYASFLAGLCFTRCGLTYVHPIAHTLGGLYNVPHGLANAIVLPYCLDYYGPKVYKKLADLAEAGGIAKAELSDEQNAKAFIAEIRRMNKAMEIPEKVDCIKDEDVDQMVAWALHEAHPLYQSPVLLNGDDLKKIIANIRA